MSTPAATAPLAAEQPPEALEDAPLRLLPGQPRCCRPPWPPCRVAGLKECQNLLPPQLPAEQDRSRCIGSVHLEYTLRQVQPIVLTSPMDASLKWCFNTSTLAHREPMRVMAACLDRMRPSQTSAGDTSCLSWLLTLGSDNTAHSDRPRSCSLELSQSKWLVTSLSPGNARFLAHDPRGRRAGSARTPRAVADQSQRTAEPTCPMIAIHEAGLDGFSVHRLLTANGVESHVVDPASIAVPRRKRRAKTDRIDGETLLRTLLAWRRGEPRVCSMVVPPSPQDRSPAAVPRAPDIGRGTH